MQMTGLWSMIKKISALNTNITQKTHAVLCGGFFFSLHSVLMRMSAVGVTRGLSAKPTPQTQSAQSHSGVLQNRTGGEMFIG